jgi:putative endonuclease
MKTKEIGNLGEKYAEKFLISQNYKILNKNFKSKFGEIDLIVFDYSRNEIAFVEIKTRTGIFFGEPEDSVTKLKKRKIIKTALYFLNSATRKDSLSWRVDVIAVKLSRHGKLEKITHFKNISLSHGA